MTKRKHLKRRVRDRALKTGESYTAALRHVRGHAQEAPMATTSKDKITVACSFCGQNNEQVKKLIAGPGVYICDECIGLCNTVLEQEASGPTPAAPAPSLDSAPLDTLVGIFGAMARTARSMEDQLAEWARKLATRGVPVATLASHAGITEAEARDRFDL